MGVPTCHELQQAHAPGLQKVSDMLTSSLNTHSLHLIKKSKYRIQDELRLFEREFIIELTDTYTTKHPLFVIAIEVTEVRSRVSRFEASFFYQSIIILGTFFLLSCGTNALRAVVFVSSQGLSESQLGTAH